VRPLFADIVRTHRLRLGLTQDDLAAKSEVSVRTVRAIEAGRIARPRPATVRRMADVFGLAGGDREQFHEAALGDRGADAARRPEGPVPAQLPADVPGFTGRRAELATLDDLIEPAEATTHRAVVISAVSGTGGVGKTALAVRWAHRTADLFPDGQVYVNLRGYDPDQPVTPADALAHILEALGVPRTDIPAEPAARAAQYRTRTTGRRLLILLDNAADAAQVRPLLPGSASCAVLITSRDRLAGLVARDGAHHIDLDLLPLGDATTLLRRLIGQRVDAEPDATATLAHQCARLPLALRIAAELAVAHPTTSLADLVAELADHRRRLALLDADGDPRTAVTAVFSWSVRHLSPQAARLFRLLGLHPGPDLTLPAAASLTAAPAPQTREWLTELTRAHLLTEHTPGRYTFHDLLRAYAAELAHTQEPADDRHAAVRRALDHYVHTGHAAAHAIDVHRDPIDVSPPAPGVTPERIDELGHAQTWFAAERAVLLAAIHQAGAAGLDAHVWQLAWTIGPFLHRSGYWLDLLTTQQAAIGATRLVNDPVNEAVAHRLLARAYERLARYEEARAHHQQSLDLLREFAPHHGGRVLAHIALSAMDAQRGDYIAAVNHAEQAVRVSVANDNRAGEGSALNAMAWYLAQLGDYPRALSYGERALAAVQEAAHPHGESGAWDTLGYIHHRLGHYPRAIECYRQALDLATATVNRYHQAVALVRIGDACAGAGDADDARAAWRRALAILVDLGHADAESVRAKLRDAS